RVGPTDAQGEGSVASDRSRLPLQAGGPAPLDLHQDRRDPRFLGPPQTPALEPLRADPLGFRSPDRLIIGSRSLRDRESDPPDMGWDSRRHRIPPGDSFGPEPHGLLGRRGGHFPPATSPRPRQRLDQRERSLGLITSSMPRPTRKKANARNVTARPAGNSSHQ